MRRRQTLALASGLLAAALAGCVSDDDDDDGDGGDDNPADGADDPDSSTDDTENGTDGAKGGEADADAVETLAHETNGFGFDLYQQILEDDENLFVSPLSIGIAFAMTYAGAESETREQMREVLRYELDGEAVHAAFEELQAELDERGHDDDGTDSEDESDDDSDGSDDSNGSNDDSQPFELSIANSVWGQEGFPFEESYLETLDAHYGGGLREVDYASDPEGAREEINDWVANETEDRIEDLLPDGALDTLTRLVLVNAIYFMANWEHTFPEDTTEKATFTALDGTEHEVDMMAHPEKRVPYAEVDGAEAVELPYVGGDVSMLVVLPPEGEFESYEADFDEATLADIVDALERREGTVELPRFEIETDIALKEPLEALGMTDAFDPDSADFQGIADTDDTLYIDDAYHDTFVAVDEEGTEAAAATGVVMNLYAAPTNPFTFSADRPFLFAIRDRPTGTVLFLGRATDPDGWD